MRHLVTFRLPIFPVLWRRASRKKLLYEYIFDLFLIMTNLIYKHNKYIHNVHKRYLGKIGIFRRAIEIKFSFLEFFICLCVCFRSRYVKLQLYRCLTKNLANVAAQSRSITHITPRSK